MGNEKSDSALSTQLVPVRSINPTGRPVGLLNFAKFAGAVWRCGAAERMKILVDCRHQNFVPATSLA